MDCLFHLLVVCFAFCCLSFVVLFCCCLCSSLFFVCLLFLVALLCGVLCLLCWCVRVSICVAKKNVVLYVFV